MEKADPCARSGVISLGSCSLPQILRTNGLVVVVTLSSLDMHGNTRHHDHVPEEKHAFYEP